MIPRTAHFLCLGQGFGWAEALSIRAALSAGGFERAVLHHSENLSGAPGMLSLSQLAGFETNRLVELLPAGMPERRALRQILAELNDVSSREDVVRAALLWQLGGVFFSLDTVAVRPFGEVCARNEFFCGESLKVHSVADSTRAALRSAALRRLSRALDRAPTMASTGAAAVWPKCASTAVLGAPQNDSFVARLLHEMTQVSVTKRRLAGALGQAALESALGASTAGAVLYPSSTFDPCSGPRAGWWFRDPRPCSLSDLSSPDTLSFRWHSARLPEQMLGAWRQRPGSTDAKATLLGELSETAEAVRID